MKKLVNNTDSKSPFLLLAAGAWLLVSQCNKQQATSNKQQVTSNIKCFYLSTCI
jgi:uncharacterized protein YabE (DUF348 family)